MGECQKFPISNESQIKKEGMGHLFSHSSILNSLVFGYLTLVILSASSSASTTTASARSEMTARRLCGIRRRVFDGWQFRDVEGFADQAFDATNVIALVRSCKGHCLTEFACTSRAS